MLFALGGLPRRLRERLSPIVDLGVGAKLLQEGLDPLLTQTLHELCTLRRLLRVPGGVISVDSPIHTKHDDAVLRSNRIAHRTDR